MNIWLKRALVAIPVVVALFFGAILLYVNVIRQDAPAELGTEDLAAAVEGGAPVASSPASSAPSPAPTASPSAAATASSSSLLTASVPVATTVAGAAGAGPYDGTWTVTDESEFGYRVEEVLFGVNTTAAGRSNQITGTMTIAGAAVTTASFSVDVASITSDDERRDTQFRGDVMDTEQFPEATFTLTAPIELGTVPADGQQVTATATGDLTLHGVTRSVTFDVTAQAATDRIGVLGSIPILFADYDIENPSRSGITTEDNGVLEFVLVFVPA